MIGVSLSQRRFAPPDKIRHLGVTKPNPAKIKDFLFTPIKNVQVDFFFVRTCILLLHKLLYPWVIRGSSAFVLHFDRWQSRSCPKLRPPARHQRRKLKFEFLPLFRFTHTSHHSICPWFASRCQNTPLISVSGSTSDIILCTAISPKVMGSLGMMCGRVYGPMNWNFFNQ